MFKLLRKWFPASNPQVRLYLEDCPKWTSTNAEYLSIFLTSETGRAMIRRLQFFGVSELLEPNCSDEEIQLARAVLMVVEGIESSADVKQWQALEGLHDHEPDEAVRYFPDEENVE